TRMARRRNASSALLSARLGWIALRSRRLAREPRQHRLAARHRNHRGAERVVPRRTDDCPFVGAGTLSASLVRSELPEPALVTRGGSRFAARNRRELPHAAARDA